jgi:hypothetical protein
MFSSDGLRDPPKQYRKWFGVIAGSGLSSRQGHVGMAKVGTFNLHLERYTRNLAIIVPYRDRLDHLKKFMPHMSATSHSIAGKLRTAVSPCLRMRAIMFAFTTWIICQYGQTIHGLGLQPG